MSIEDQPQDEQAPTQTQSFFSLDIKPLTLEGEIKYYFERIKSDPQIDDSTEEDSKIKTTTPPLERIPNYKSLKPLNLSNQNPVGLDTITTQDDIDSAKNFLQDQNAYDPNITLALARCIAKGFKIDKNTSLAEVMRRIMSDQSKL
jgi:hypothetical protein